MSEDRNSELGTLFQLASRKEVLCRAVGPDNVAL